MSEVDQDKLEFARLLIAIDKTTNISHVSNMNYFSEDDIKDICENAKEFVKANTIKEIKYMEAVDFLARRDKEMFDNNNLDIEDMMKAGFTGYNNMSIDDLEEAYEEATGTPVKINDRW